MSDRLPRVLLVDDDASIRRLVEMVLEDEALELLCCASGEAALAQLAAGPVDLLITDLMMPGLSGFDLLEKLRAEPALRGNARLVAFSAGLTAERKARLADLGVEVLLDKPVSVDVMLHCVRAAVGMGTDAQRSDGQAPLPFVPAGFCGDGQLYAAFLSTCLRQYPQDIEQGNQALQQGDHAALRRVAHNLKGSLRILGEDALADSAWGIERLAAQASQAGRLGPEGPDAWRSFTVELQRCLARLSSKSI